ncbi:hypothetical protein CSB08_01130 [Candidatus Gracilibacteria bacterium]|nr:MAG: hypothetical protein CSB08_01130 [Candidatus Gracilibacteria bacterium]
MLLKLLKKQKNIKSKRKMIETIIKNLSIPDNQKFLFLNSLEVLDENGIEGVYSDLILFVNNVEIKNLEEIKKNNFSIINGMTKKEAEKKKKELNSFSFLLHNL